MKKFIFPALLLALVLLPCLRAFADISLLDTEKSKLQLYGFFKLDAAYQDGGMNGLTFPRYAIRRGRQPVPFRHPHPLRLQVRRHAAEQRHERLAAVLEWDFFDTTSPNQMKLRFRQGYFSLAKNGHSLLFGQAWDLFSPLGPTTLMTNGYLWQTGNLGFRHAQVRYAYSAPRLDFAVSLNDPATSGGWRRRCRCCRGAWGSSWARATSTSSAFRASTAGRTPKALYSTKFSGTRSTIAGVSLDWNLAFCKLLALKGEYARGENLSYVSSRANFLFDTQS